MIVVFDKGGLEGQLAQDKDPDTRVDALALLADGRRVRIPAGMLKQRDPGAYELPVHFSELEARASADGLVIPVHEEHVALENRKVERRVEIRKTVSEQQRVLELPRWREEVEIERVRLDLPVDGPVPVREEGDTLVIPLLEEEIVTVKRFVLREEVRVRKRQIREDRTGTVRVRREDATVIRSEPGEKTKADGNRRLGKES